jgi:hypothetical protein
VDAAVNRLNFTVIQTTDLAIPSAYIKRHKDTLLCPGKQKFYIKDKKLFLATFQEV